jgi:hypothetical protein
MGEAGGSGSEIPYVDEHTVRVDAPAAAVWRALGASLRGGRGGRLASVVLGIVPDRASGDPLTSDATIPGFAVRDAVAGHRLALEGRHRFSEYSLVFTLDERDGVTDLTARTDALFPGLRGRAYRLLVIGTGGHRLIVRRWLRRIGRSAEAT